MPIRIYDSDDWARSVAFNSDASRFVIGTVNGTSKLWDTAEDEQIGEAFLHDGVVYSVAFDPSSAFYRSIDSKHNVRTFSAATGAPLSAPIVHGADVHAAVFSPIPGDFRLVTASGDGTARVWNAVTGQPLSPPLVHPGPVLFALFSPDGKHIRTSGGPDGLTLWDAASGKPVNDLFLLNETVTCAAYSADGAMLAVGTQEGWVYIWDTATAKKTCPPLNHDGRVKSVAFSASGDSVLTATLSSVHHWSLPSGKPRGEVIRCGTYVRAASLSPGEQYILVVTGEGPARVWDADSGLPAGDSFLLDVQTEMACFDPRFPGTFSATRFKGAIHRRRLPRHPASIPRLLSHAGLYFEEFGLSPAIDTLWVRYRERAVRFWDVASGELRDALELPDGDPSAIVAYSHSAGRLLVAKPDGTAQLFDAAAKSPIGAPLYYFEENGIACFSPDGALLVTSVERDAVQRWDASTGLPIGGPLVHPRRVPHASFSPDGRFIVTYCWDDTASLWLAGAADPEPNRFSNEQPVSPSQFSPGGDLLVLFNKEHGAVLWDIDSGTVAGTAMPHRGEAKSVVFSPSGDRLLIASSDGAVRIWDIKAGNILRSVLLHDGSPTAAAFHPDGTLIATAAGHKVRFWDVESGAPVGPPLIHDLDVSAVAFSPTGDLLITAEGFYAGDVRIWPFDPEGSLSGDVASYTRAAAAVGGYAVNEYGSLVPVPSQIAECNRLLDDDEQPEGPFTEFIRGII